MAPKVEGHRQEPDTKTDGDGRTGRRGWVVVDRRQGADDEPGHSPEDEAHPGRPPRAAQDDPTEEAHEPEGERAPEGGRGDRPPGWVGPAKERGPELRPEAMEPAKAEGEADDDAGDEAKDDSASEAHAGDTKHPKGRRPGDADGPEASDGDPPADGTEEPLAEEEDEAKGEEGAGEEEGSDGEANEGRRPPELLGDGGSLGPGEGDVGRDDSADGGDEPGDLLAEADLGPLAVARGAGIRPGVGRGRAGRGRPGRIGS